MILRHLLVAMRPHQWIKNVLVLAALVFSEHLFDPVFVLRSLAALGLFCMISGSVYLVNDIRDLENDRQHPDKRSRPIASGLLPVPVAMTAAVVLAAVAVWLAFRLDGRLGFVFLAYGTINLAYSLWLQHVVILDVMIIAGGFLLRAAAGAFAISVPVSSWFILCTLLLALFMGFVKRRQEILLLEENAGDHRRILDEYTPPFLDQMIAITTAGALVCYALYTMSPEVVLRTGTPYLYLTVPFVIYGLLRYLYLVHTKDQGGNPSLTILKDPSLLINLFLWFATVVILLYP